MSWKAELVERGWVPDFATRWGIRMLLRGRLRKENPVSAGFLEQMGRSPLALATDLANVQHYEVPADFFSLVLGPRHKYSCCLYEEGVDDLAAAEEAMLRLTCEQAGVADGMEILELGCGWGSVSLWIAEKYRDCRITAVSNSATQKAFIEAEADRRGLGGIEVVTADMNEFETERRFDRVVSVEMFEHMRNYEMLLERISSWLRPAGKLFVHIFCHRHVAYFYELDGEDDWMARHFFTGGLMPSFDLLSRFPRHMAVVDSWEIDGTHYARTLRAWLERFDARADAIHELFVEVYGRDQARRWMRRWRMFFMACEELFAFRGGEEWLVGHYLLARAG